MTRVLHVLDHSLPLHSGYTFRTRAILKAQQAAGLDVRGVTGLRHEAEGPSVEQADGLLFHRTAGSAEGPAGLREWRARWSGRLTSRRNQSAFAASSTSSAWPFTRTLFQTCAIFPVSSIR